MLQAAAAAAPTLDPSATLPIAQGSPDAGTAAQTARAAAGFLDAQQLKAQYEQQNKTAQVEMAEVVLLLCRRIGWRR